MTACERRFKSVRYKSPRYNNLARYFFCRERHRHVRNAQNTAAAAAATKRANQHSRDRHEARMLFAPQRSKTKLKKPTNKVNNNNNNTQTSHMETTATRAAHKNLACTVLVYDTRVPSPQKSHTHNIEPQHNTTRHGVGYSCKKERKKIQALVARRTTTSYHRQHLHLLAPTRTHATKPIDPSIMTQQYGIQKASKHAVQQCRVQVCTQNTTTQTREEEHQGTPFVKTPTSRAATQDMDS